MKNNKKPNALATVLSCTFVVAAYLIANSAIAAEAPKAEVSSTSHQ